MTCHICGGKLEKVTTNLPFKVDDNSIVIIKSLPVLQCRNCSEYLIEDAVMARVDVIRAALMPVPNSKSSAMLPERPPAASTCN